MPCPASVIRRAVRVGRRRAGRRRRRSPPRRSGPDVQHPVGDGWVRSVVEGERDGRVLGVPSSRRQAPAGGDQRRCIGLAVPVGALGVRRPPGQRAALQHQFDEVGPARGGARQGVRVHGAELRPGRQGPRVGPQHPEPGREQAAVHHAVGAVDDAGQLGAALAGTLPQQPGQSAGPAGRHVHPGTGHGRGRVPEGHVQTGGGPGDPGIEHSGLSLRDQ